MTGIGLLLAIITFVMVLVAFRRIARLEARIGVLKAELEGRAPRAAALEAGPDAEPAAESEAAGPAPDEQEAQPAAVPSRNWGGAATVAEPVAAMVSDPEPAPQVAPPPRPAPAKPRDMEQALASRWFVWIGGVAIAIGGLLFVKYAYDEGLISPSLQVFLGILAGLCLVAAGEWVRRRTMDPDSYVPAALSAAGLATLFAAIFAAYALYGLVSPMVAFAGLALVGLGALVLSRWQGPFIAALGLLGSYVTPALIPSSDPDAWGFFPYLAVIVAASFAVLRGRDWWWLGYASLFGAAVWAVLWIGGPFEIGDIVPVGLFALATMLVAFFGIRGRAILAPDSGDLTKWTALTPPLAIGLAGLGLGVLQLGALVQHTDHAAVALVFFAAAMVLWLALAWAKSGIAALAPAAGLLMFACLMSWREAAFHAVTMDEHGIYTWSNAFTPETRSFLRWMLFSGAACALTGVAGVLLRPAARSWGLLGGLMGFLFVAGAWGRTDVLMTESTWAVIGAVIALGLLAGTYVANSRADDAAANRGAGLLAAGAAALLVFALDRVLDRIWLTTSIAGLAFVYAVASNVLRPKLMGAIAVALASLATIRIFLSRELWFDDRTLPWGQHWVIYGYGVPAALFYAGARFLQRAGHMRSAVALEGMTLGLIVSLVSMELRVLIGGGYFYDDPSFLEMAANVLAWLGMGYGLLYRQGLFSSVISKWGARLIIAVAVAAIVVLSLGALNPVVTGEPVPGNIVFNGLLLAYLAPIVLIGLIVRKLDVIGWQDVRPYAGGLALLLAFVYVTLQTKLVFQGRIMVPESLSLGESYAYSAVWLVFALALFIAGLRWDKQYVRYAGLGVMVLVVLKVFLVDMSNLAGLYRIASFIGLGLCLVGIGWLYQRFVQRPARDAA